MIAVLYIKHENCCKIAKGRGYKLVCLGTAEAVHSLVYILP